MLMTDHYIIAIIIISIIIIGFYSPFVAGKCSIFWFPVDFTQDEVAAVAVLSAYDEVRMSLRWA